MMYSCPIIVHFIRFGAMKSSLTKKILSVGSLGLTFSSYAGTVIYGLENALQANNCRSSSIQVASFNQSSNATRYQHKIQSLTQYPVRVLHIGEYYKVLIGPVSSTIELHNTAQAVLSGLNSKAPLKSHQIIKTSVSSRPVVRQPELKKNNTGSSEQQFSVPAESFTAKKQPIALLSKNQWFLTVGSGAQFPHEQENAKVANGSDFPPPANVDSYSINQPNASAIILLSAGHRWTFNQQWMPAFSLGLDYQYLSPYETNGTITQYSNPLFNNYSYQIKTSSNVLLVAAKANVFQLNRFSPYISGGLGGAVNDSYNYNETAFSGVTPRISPAFKHNTNTEFAYHVGAGLDLDLSSSFLISVGYLYQNIGKVVSGNGVTTWSKTSLNLNEAAQNEIIASVSYLY